MGRLNKYEALMIFGILIVDAVMLYFIWLELQIIQNKDSRSHN
jgi:hypothetical protein